MSSPSPFEVAQLASNNAYKAFKGAKDSSVLEQILSESMATNDPKIVQDNIGKILSQVSPERQGTALNYLSNVMQNIEKKQTQAQQFKREEEAGLIPGINPTAQTAIYKENAKQKYMNQLTGGNQPQQNITQAGAPQQIQQEELSIENTQPQQAFNPTQSRVGGIDYSKFSDNEIVQLQASPYPEVARGATADSNRRLENRKLEQERNNLLFKSNLTKADKIIQEADNAAIQMPKKDTALKLMDDAIVSRNLGWFSGDNLAEITGFEGFRSKEGAIFKTAGKEYFLGNISRAGTRPNQWIEQQISDMMAKIGRDTSANLSVTRALRNEFDLDKARIDFTYSIAERLEKEGKLDKANLGRELNKKMAEFSEEKQDILFNDLRAIKAIDEKKAQVYKKVKEGTPVSQYMAQSLLLQNNNNPEKAAEQAKKLGYEF